MRFPHGFLKRGFNDGTVCEDTTESADEKSFVVNLETENTVGIIGDLQNKHADVISVDNPRKLMAQYLSPVNATIKPPRSYFKS